MIIVRDLIPLTICRLTLVIRWDALPPSSGYQNYVQMYIARVRNYVSCVVGLQGMWQVGTFVGGRE